MKFHLSEEQAAMMDSVRGTLGDLLSPETRLAFIDDNSDRDIAVWDGLMQLGLGSIMLPEQHGGGGLGLLDLALMTETIGEAAAPGPFIQHLIATWAIASCDEQDVKERLLVSLSEGTTVATLAFDEGWVPEKWSVEWNSGTVTGTARVVPGAMSASVYLIGTAGGGLALVEGDQGVEKTAVQGSDRSRPAATMRFENAAALSLFAPGDPRVARIFDAALILTAADALGGAQHCLDLSVAYAKEREQFGQPVGRFQALKHQLSAMAMEVEPARALLWYAAHTWDAQLPNARHSAAQAKAHITDRYVVVSRAAVEAHGAIGYTWEYGLHIWLRRALFNQAYLGPPTTHRARAAALSGW